MDNDTMVENDILLNAFYMISLFEKAKNELANNLNSNNSVEKDINEKNLNLTIISNLKLQKLMYFVEAYYMVENDKEFLYSDDWSAWNYGPVCKRLYNYFKKFGSLDISLSEDEKKDLLLLPQKNKDYIEKIYNIFGSFNAFELVTLTHLPNSPWDNVKNNKDFQYDFDKFNSSIIDKIETKKWFKEKFSFFFNQEEL